jgi:hypothetical protein
MLKTFSGNGGKDDGIGLSEDCGFGKSQWAIGVLRVRRRLEILPARPPRKPWRNFSDETPGENPHPVNGVCVAPPNPNQQIHQKQVWSADPVLSSWRKPPDKMEDLDMTEAAAMGKRAAPTESTESSGKKKNNKRIQIVEPEVDETVVSTKANPHIFNPFLGQLSDRTRQLATMPYSMLCGEDKGDLRAFHDDLQQILMMTGRWIYDVTTLQQDKIKQLKEAPATAPIITTSKWTKIMRILFTEGDDDLPMLSAEEKERFRMIGTRLSFTKPKAITLTGILNSKTEGTHATRAWRGAINVLGSAYNKPEKEDSGSQKKGIQTQTAKKANQMGIQQFFSPNHKESQVLQQEKMVTPSPQSKAMINRQNAGEILKACTHSIRLMVALKLDKQEDKTPNDLAMEQIKELFKRYKKNDPSACIVPWRTDQLMSNRAIITTDDIPENISELKKIYAEGLRPKSNSTCWFKLHIGATEEPVHFTSTSDSDTQDFFMDTSHLAYLCTVQDSDDTVDLCDFIYSGPFMNPSDMELAIRKALQQKSNRQFKFGCRVRKTKELPEQKNVKDWLLKPNMMVHLEADRHQAKHLKLELYLLFNKVNEDGARPGGYNVRVLPDKSQMRSGTRGARDRVNMLKKHQANTLSLSVFKSFDIKEIDTPQACNHGSYSLRQLLLEVTFPLVPNKKKKAPKLFFSIDYAFSGQDKEKGAVYLTAYHDRKELAAKVVDILPAFIDHYYGRQLTKKWCHPAALGMIQDITFLDDADGNDIGEWTMLEDEMGRDILDEDMGVQLNIGNLALMEFEADERVLLNADDASVTSFRSALGAGQRINDDQSDAVVPGATQATLAQDAMSSAGAV